MCSRIVLTIKQSICRQIFTNAAEFDAKGQLLITEYHFQDYCPISAINMCKGRILQDYIAQRCSQGQKFEKIVYAGDGQNDLCPSLTLSSENDLVCPRKGYSFDKILNKDVDTKNKIKARIAVWSSGLEILTRLDLENTSLHSVEKIEAKIAATLPTPPPSPNDE